jgi:signal transduction histidine kinase
MKRTALEPGLLHIFRLLVGARLVLLSASMCSQLTRPEPRTLRYPFLGIVESLFLVGYLSWPWLRQQLGRIYLPLALTVASVGPILEHTLTVGLRLRNGVSGAAAGADVWQLILVLCVVLILLSWQYSFKSVVVFCVGSAVLDLVLAIPLAVAGGPRLVIVWGLIIVRSLLFALAGYVVVRLMTAQRAQREALAQANARLAHYATTLEQLAVSRERNRLARELHDTLAHTLSGAAVQLEAASALWDNDAVAARSMLEQSLQAIRTGLQEARRAIHALRAAPLEDLGLVLAVRQLAESAAGRAGLSLDLRVPEHVKDVKPEVEQCVYRVADEALNNVARHAGARCLSVRLAQTKERLLLTISDDGRGFDPGRAPADGHYGLHGMRERAHMVGGSLAVESQSGHGTTVRLVIADYGRPTAE